MPSKFSTYLYPENNAAQRLKIACTAMSCDQDPAKNRARMQTLITDLIRTDPTVELVIFGEMILGWYQPGESPEYHQQISEPVPGETTQALAVLAQQYKIYICFGLSELVGGKVYNSQVLLNPQGEIQAVHRKRNLKPGEMQANHQPGSARVTTTKIKGFPTGLVICSDTADPDTMWQLMRGKQALIIHSLADDDQDDFVTKFQARLYDAWFVTANRHGQESQQYWPGLITVSDPLGEIRGHKLGQQQVLVSGLRFAQQGSWLQRTLRNIWVKTPLIFHVLRNWKQAKSYL